jgi:2-polyprenyl-3-methyl-5-hydroxy-6-metoxy-1,4-benzoquinol methylase
MNYDSLAALYERQYANYRDDIAFYGRLAERLGANRVLELGAGAGRVSVPLARRGLEVTALELSPEMLERGQAFAAREHVSINWIQSDMRDFDLGRTFPLVIAPFNALMHLYTLPDQDSALERIVAHLEPGGVFAFDLYQPRFGPEKILRHEGETFTDADGARTDVLVRQRVDRTAQLALTTYFVDRIAPGGTLSREVLELQQRYFTRFELERWFKAFRLELHGDFDGSRLTDTSPLFVGLARVP